MDFCEFLRLKRGNSSLIIGEEMPDDDDVLLLSVSRDDLNSLDFHLNRDQARQVVDSLEEWLSYT